MKEAIGGSWLYTLVIVMIALFTTFVSVTTNYARTYKIKDHLISIIEKNGGVTPTTLTQIKEYLDGIGYSSIGSCPERTGDSSETWFAFTRDSTTGPANGFGDRASYCIYKHVISCRLTGKDSRGGKSTTKFIGEMGTNSIPRAYYGVAAFFRLDWPILRQVINMRVTGETATLYSPNQNYEIKAFEDLSKCKS